LSSRQRPVNWPRPSSCWSRRSRLLRGIDSFEVQYAQALLEIASVRRARGQTKNAVATVEQARAPIGEFADPGMLPALLDSTERGMRRPALGGSMLPHPSANGSWWSCGCSPPDCQPGKSLVSSSYRSTPSGPKSRLSTASFR
jgi:hypothetical protein